MVTIPDRFVPSIKQIIEWHLEVYVPDMKSGFNTRLERILEHFFERHLVDGTVQVEESELYYLNECVSDATNNIPECGIGEDVVWEIYHWVRAEREKVNT